METVYLGDRKISIRTSILEEKATACNMLCCYADELKEGFLPYVEEVTRAVPSSLWTSGFFLQQVHARSDVCADSCDRISLLKMGEVNLWHRDHCLAL